MTVKAPEVSQEAQNLVTSLRTKFNDILTSVREYSHPIDPVAREEMIKKLHESNMWLMFGLQMGALAVEKANEEKS